MRFLRAIYFGLTILIPAFTWWLAARHGALYLLLGLTAVPPGAFYVVTAPKVTRALERHWAPSAQEGPPASPVRTARYPDPGDLPARQRGKTCRICGMADPERFRLKIGVRQWRGWPAHESCVEWLESGTVQLGTAKVRACCGTDPAGGHEGRCPNSFMSGGTGGNTTITGAGITVTAHGGAGGTVPVLDPWELVLPVAREQIVRLFGIPPPQMGGGRGGSAAQSSPSSGGLSGS